MKNLFPQFDKAPRANYAELWKSALFVFDTNVLLNLYRYRSSTRDELIAVLKGISDRVWIPYQVALEYQRNRLPVISAEAQRIRNTRAALDKARTGFVGAFGALQLGRRNARVDVAPLYAAVDTAIQNFQVHLHELEATQQKPTEEDAIKSELETIFSGRVGPPNPDQKAVDALYKEAEERFKHSIPPGYLDSVKGQKEADHYLHNGITYRSKYGDYLVWKELLAYCAKTHGRVVVFVTSDVKEDWWQGIEFDGWKTIGPRPELIEEATREAGVEHLLFYDTERFLQFAQQYLSASISAESLAEVREVSITEAALEAQSAFADVSEGDSVTPQWGTDPATGAATDYTQAMMIKKLTEPFREQQEMMRKLTEPFREQQEMMRKLTEPAREQQEMMRKLMEPLQEHRKMSNAITAPLRARMERLRKQAISTEAEAQPLLVDGKGSFDEFSDATVLDAEQNPPIVELRVVAPILDDEADAPAASTGDDASSPEIEPDNDEGSFSKDE